MQPGCGPCNQAAGHATRLRAVQPGCGPCIEAARRRPLLEGGLSRELARGGCAPARQTLIALSRRAGCPRCWGSRTRRRMDAAETPRSSATERPARIAAKARRLPSPTPQALTHAVPIHAPVRAAPGARAVRETPRTPRAAPTREGRLHANHLRHHHEIRCGLRHLVIRRTSATHCGLRRHRETRRRYACRTRYRHGRATHRRATRRHRTSCHAIRRCRRTNHRAIRR